MTLAMNLFVNEWVYGCASGGTFPVMNKYRGGADVGYRHCQASRHLTVRLLVKLEFGSTTASQTVIQHSDCR